MNIHTTLHWSQDDDGVIQQMASPLDPKMIHDHLLRIPDAMYGLEDQPQMQTAVQKTLTLNSACYLKVKCGLFEKHT